MLGQLYFEGTYLARTSTGFTALPLSVAASSLEAAFAAATAAPGVLVGTATTIVPMQQSWPIWNQGAMVPQAQYDGLLWLRDVTPTTLR